ncbi:MAG: glutaredoxin family protein [Egibacteraceae bacterium]
MVTILPLMAACVAWTFAAQLGRAFVLRRRDHALAWACSLGLFGLASMAVTVGASLGWSEPVFAVYWVSGALLNVPLLAVGQLLLLAPRWRRVWWAVGGIVALAAIGAMVAASPASGVLDEASAASAIPLGSQVLGSQVAYTLVGPLNATFLVVVLGSLWSAVRTRRWGVLLIALGVSVAAAGSSAVGAGRDALFSVLLASGVSLMYAGFRSVGRLPQRDGASMSRSRAAGPLVTVYTRAGCALCREAEQLVHRLARGRARVELIDVDEEPALVERYTVRVPVVAVDGEEVAELQVDAGHLRAVLDARLRSPVPAFLTRQAAIIALALHGALAIVPFASTRLIAPWWALVLLYSAWAWLGLAGLGWMRDRPTRTLLVPVVALLGWVVLVGLVSAGSG